MKITDKRSPVNRLFSHLKKSETFSVAGSTSVFIKTEKIEEFNSVSLTSGDHAYFSQSQVVTPCVCELIVTNQ